VVLSLPRDSYVVTRSRPYRARQSREVEAVSGWRLGIQRVRGGLGEPRPTILPPEALLSHLCTASVRPL